MGDGHTQGSGESQRFQTYRRTRSKQLQDRLAISSVLINRIFTWSRKVERRPLKNLMTEQSPNRPANSLRPTRARHAVLALVVAAYVITYMDRVNISSAMPVIQRDLGLTAITVGWIFSSFRWGYALFQIPGGWFGDKYGPRRALAVGRMLGGSVFTSLTAAKLERRFHGLLPGFYLAVGEAGTSSHSNRSLSRWMPRDERGFSQGYRTRASRLGAAVTPPLVQSSS